MILTTAQLQTLKTWLQANAGSLNDQEAADALNAPATPGYVVYRSSVLVSEVMLNGFDWTRVDNLSVGKARIWEWLTRAKQVGQQFVFDPSKPNIRAGINATWVGTQADLNVRAAVYVHCTRNATVAEKLLKTAGNGISPDGSGDGPATMGAEGPVTVQNVVDAHNS